MFHLVPETRGAIAHIFWKDHGESSRPIIAWKIETLYAGSSEIRIEPVTCEGEMPDGPAYMWCIETRNSPDADAKWIFVAEYECTTLEEARTYARNQFAEAGEEKVPLRT